jgi:uncharacterized membrane protein (DUF373 family)
MADQIAPEPQEPESRRREIFRKTADGWRNLDFYGRFEQAVSLVLLLLISGVIVAALGHLVFEVARDVFFDLSAPIDVVIFQEIFAMVMTVLIALEFNHTILSILQRKESVVQVKTVILIAILALARKFVILDVNAVAPLVVIGLAIAVLALGCVHWLVGGRHHRHSEGIGTAPAE